MLYEVITLLNDIDNDEIYNKIFIDNNVMYLGTRVRNNFV